MDALLTPRDVDSLLRYPHGRSLKLARKGKLPSIVLPDGEVRFRRREIEILIDGDQPAAATEDEKSDEGGAA